MGFGQRKTVSSAHGSTVDEQATQTAASRPLAAARDAQGSYAVIWGLALAEGANRRTSRSGAHARGQVSCAAELIVPADNARVNGSASGSAQRHGRKSDADRQAEEPLGCSSCACWEGVGAARAYSGGQCNFTRTYSPTLPDHCWEPQQAPQAQPSESHADTRPLAGSSPGSSSEPKYPPPIGR